MTVEGPRPLDKIARTVDNDLRKSGGAYLADELAARLALDAAEAEKVRAERAALKAQLAAREPDLFCVHCGGRTRVADTDDARGYSARTGKRFCGRCETWVEAMTGPQLASDGEPQ
jgi:hypothetical protein